MVLEEIFGSLVSLFSRLIIQTPGISRENLPKEYTVIFEENPEQDEVFDGLIHCEYEQETPAELPYYEEDVPVLVQANEQPRRTFWESFLRSCKANIGLLIVAVFILGLLTIGVVFVDLNTTDVCIEWKLHKNLTIPTKARILHIVGDCLALLPLFTWFPVCVAMLWGLKEFRKNYLLCLFLPQLVMGSIACVYRIYESDKVAATNVDYSKYRLPGHAIVIFSILCDAYLVSRKFKKVNPATSYGVFRIFFILSFAFLGACLLAFTYRYIIIKYFKETKGGIKKAIIAAFTPGLFLPLTAIAKYLVVRKSSEIITPDRAYVLCYFLRGGMITLYRTMQSGFQDIWLFISLSLLHGVSNVLSKATLNFRIKIWTFFIKYYNKTNCGSRLEVQPLNSPRIRRFNADLEIQNILFEYATIILSQAYLACFVVMNFDVPVWQVLRGFLIKIAISMAIDFVFNIISVFIQIHYYDIPMRHIWMKYWLRHVTGNAFIIISMIAYFGASLVSVFSDFKSLLKEYKLRNCTSVF